MGPCAYKYLGNFSVRCELAYTRSFGSPRVLGDGGLSCDQGGDERSEEGFSASSGVVDELEEARIDRQFLPRDASVRTRPGAEQRPAALRGIDVRWRPRPGDRRYGSGSMALGRVDKAPGKRPGSKWPSLATSGHSLPTSKLSGVLRLMGYRP